MGTTGYFLGVKWPGRKADHSPPSSAEVKEWVELYLHSPNTPSWHGSQLNHGCQLRCLLSSPDSRFLLDCCGCSLILPGSRFLFVYILCSWWIAAVSALITWLTGSLSIVAAVSDLITWLTVLGGLLWMLSYFNWYSFLVSLSLLHGSCWVIVVTMIVAWDHVTHANDRA
jgi:hypothetical protein